MQSVEDQVRLNLIESLGVEMSVQNVKMFPSHGLVRPQHIQRSTIISFEPTLLSPVIGQLSNQRSFSWGPRHRFSHKSAVNIWKGFSTQDYARARKQLYRGTFWTRQYPPFRQSLRHPADEERRFSSSWRNIGTHPFNVKRNTLRECHDKGKVTEDWYSTYQREKKQQYDAFMQRMEADPIGMLFGRTWEKWINAAENKLTRISTSEEFGDINGQKHGQGRSDPGFSSHRQRAKPVDTKNTSPRSSTDTTAKGDNQDKDYTIDPITNRKVPKASTVTKAFNTTKSTSKSATTKPQESFEIPVKRFSSPIVNPQRGHKIDVEITGTTEEVDTPNRPSLADTRRPIQQKDYNNQGKEDPQDLPLIHASDGKPRAKASRIESALDRHVQTKNCTGQEEMRPALRYTLTENTSEDVDLLRPSDVRASSGLRGKPARERDVEKQIRLQELEDQYDSRPIDRENQLLEEVGSKSAKQNLSTNISSPPRNSESHSDSEPKAVSPTALKQKELMPIDTTKDLANKISNTEPVTVPESGGSREPSVQSAAIKKAAKIQAQIVPLKVRLDAIKADYDALRQRWLDEKRRREEKTAKNIKDVHEAEIKAQKMAMEAMETRICQDNNSNTPPAANDVVHKELNGKPDRWQLQSYLPGEGDVASNVHEFVNRNRWYKKKAPHADMESEARLKQLTNDKYLIKEVREIYEDTYGTIDTHHRQLDAKDDTKRPKSFSTDQASTAIEKPSNSSSTSSLYRILAYDSKQKRVVCSKATTLAPSSKEQSLLPVDALAALNNPGRFLADLMNLHSKGYTTVSVTNETLVLKRTVNCDESQKIGLQGISEVDHSIDSTALPREPRGSVKPLLGYEKTGSKPKSHVEQPTNRTDSAAPQSASGAPVEEPSADLSSANSKVHREEAVFSGPPRGNWQEVERRRFSKRSKRAGKRSKRVKNMLMTGTITAACCYAIGVVSQMMQ